jgi:hypothetical protein
MPIILDGTTGSTEPAITLTGSTSGTVTISAPAVAGTQTYTLPTAVPASNGQVLSSTTAGVLSWTSGAVGYTGSAGYTGSSGTGYSGSAGYTGSSGTGYTGSAGTGSVGYTGSAGPGTLNSGTVGYVPFYNASTTLGPPTSGNLFWDNTNTRLGIANGSPTARLHVSGGGNDLIQFGTKVFTACAGKTIYVTTGGNDTTGTGSVGAPYLTVTRAVQDIPYYLTADVTINIGAGTFTVGSVIWIRGRFGGGYAEGSIYITGAGSGSTTLAMGDTGGFNIYDVDAPVYIQSMNITCGTAVAMYATRCRWISIANTVTMSLTPNNAGWNARITVTDSTYFDCQAAITLTSGATAGLGGVIVLYAVAEAYLAGSITKSGARFGNTGVSVCSNTTLMLQMTIDNFYNGVAVGVNHYGAEGPATVISNSTTIRNCQYGFYITANSTLINYYTIFTSNTQDIYNLNGDVSGQANISSRLGINLSGALCSTSYVLQVNGNPAAAGYTAWTNYSDARLKENVENFGTGPVLDKIAQLRPVSFNYNELTGFDEAARERRASGFIAQELETVFPDMVGTTTIRDTEYLDTNLSNLNLYLVKAIQELKAVVDAQAVRIAALEAK